MSHISFPQLFSFFERCLFGLAFYAIFGGILYYLNLARTPFLLLILFPVIWLIYAIKLPAFPEFEPKFPSKNLTKNMVLLGLFFTLIASWWGMVFPISIVESTRSLWLYFPPAILGIFGLASAILLLFAQRNERSPFAFFLLFTLLISGLSLAAVLFPLGFGFDPFIHRATVSHIATFGTISPKPLYYAGQYALELFASEVLRFQLHGFDRFFLPLFASFNLSLLTFKSFIQHRLSAFSLFTLFLLPLSAFIITTPQSLAYLFSINAIFFLFDFTKEPSKTSALPPIIFTLASLFTHPIAGIPTVFILLFSFLFHLQIGTYQRQLALFVTTIIGCISIPLLFFVNGAVSGLPLSFSFSALSLKEFAFLLPYTKNHFQLFDGIYFIGNNLWILLAGTTIIGFFHAKTTYTKILMLGILVSLANYAILSFGVDFSFLPIHEKQNYADRLLFMAAFFCFPLALQGFSVIGRRLEKASAVHHIGAALLIASLSMSSVYFMYPRHDDYIRSGGFTVSLADKEIVHAIEQRAQNNTYLVLANQAVSAAALETFGFKQYFHGTIFYYPIPTGGELYTHFLAMNDMPNLATIQNVRELTDASTVFFVVNDYWWNAKNIIEQTKSLTDDWFTSEDGTIHVFVFEPLP